MDINNQQPAVQSKSILSNPDLRDFVNTSIDHASVRMEGSKCSDASSGIINLNIKKFNHVTSSNRNTPVQNSRNHLVVSGASLSKPRSKGRRSPNNIAVYPAIFEPSMFSKSVSPLMCDFKTESTQNNLTAILDKTTLMIPKAKELHQPTKSRNPNLHLPISKSSNTRFLNKSK